MAFPRPGGGGSNPATIPVVRKFPFAFNTAGILTGGAVYIPTIGDVLIDAWIEIDTLWDGTTPKADFGTFVGATQGLFSWVGAAPALALDASGGGAFTEPQGTGIAFGNISGHDHSYQLSVYGTTQAAQAVPAKFTAANPIKIVVSQNGAVGGADPGSTQGAAVLYLVTATPT